MSVYIVYTLLNTSQSIATHAAASIHCTPISVNNTLILQARDAILILKFRHIIKIIQILESTIMRASNLELYVRLMHIRQKTRYIYIYRA